MAEDNPGPDLRCPRCGLNHTIVACPHVKAIEFSGGYANADADDPVIARVEFLTPADYGPAPAPGENPLPSYEKLGEKPTWVATRK